ncbi:MAG: P-loop NTPase fold protein [Nocardioides sp.]
MSTEPASATQPTLFRIEATHGAVLSVALGHDLIVSAGLDGTVRRWDATSGQPIGEPLTGHTGRVLSVALGHANGQELIVSAGDDGTVLVWLTSELMAGPRPDPSVRDLAAADIERTHDHLRREVLAAYLDRLLDRVSRVDQERQRAVFHLDGRWGSGKSTLIELLLDPRLAGSVPPPQRRISDPLVIRYDAWRESAVAPEWWSVATALHREVRASRSFPTQALMSLVDLTARLARARSSLVALTALGILAAGRWLGWWSSLNVAGNTLTVLVAVLAFGVTAGRLLFWLSPVIGTLHARNDDNPLAEIAAAVTRLRRWVPRRSDHQMFGDSAVAGGLSLATLWWVLTFDSDTTAAPWIRALGERLINWRLPLSAAILTALLAAVAYWRIRNSPSPGTNQIPETPKQNPAGGRVHQHVATGWTYLAAVGIVAAIFAVPTPYQLARHATLVAIALALVQIGGFAYWTTRLTTSTRRRPVLLVIDDLDRCPAERVVRLLETVHTLMREPDRARVLTRWRRPAALLVLIAADGRWVRQAFSIIYDDFAPLSGPVHGLGSDFIQKLFDHTVLVPALSAGQVDSYVNAVSETRASKGSDRQASRPRSTLPPAAGHSIEVIKEEIAASTAENLQSPELTSRIRSVTDDSDRYDLLHARGARAAEADIQKEREEHLLKRYVDILPNNPRLVKRAANAVGMIWALKDHLGHDEPMDTMARAAVLLIRFPELVDCLLTEVDPPSVDPSQCRSGSPWLRRDVQKVLGAGTSIEALARCYGRTYDPPVTAAPY